jgi:hypothetical protein
MSNVRVVGEARDAEYAEQGQQEQTVFAANASLRMIPGASAVVMLSFAPKDNGGFVVEVGVAGTGPVGFGQTVADTMRAAAETVGAAMTAQEWRGLRDPVRS